MSNLRGRYGEPGATSTRERRESCGGRGVSRHRGAWIGLAEVVLPVTCGARGEARRPRTFLEPEFLSRPARRSTVSAQAPLRESAREWEAQHRRLEAEMEARESEHHVLSARLDEPQRQLNESVVRDYNADLVNRNLQDFRTSFSRALQAQGRQQDGRAPKDQGWCRSM